MNIMLKKTIGLLGIVIGMACTGTAEVAVELTFNDAGDVLVARELDVNTTNEATYAWSDTAPLFNGFANNGQHIYGAYTLTGSNSVAGANLAIQNGSDYIRFYGLNSTTTENHFVAFSLWDSADFLQSGLDSFDTRVDSALTLGLRNLNNAGGARFVIRAEGEMYVSSIEYTSTGTKVLRGTDIDAGLEWGTFSTNDWSLFDSGAADLGMGVTNFAQKVFTNNITGVGFIAEGARPNVDAVLRIGGFKAELVTEPQDPDVGVDAAVVVDLDKSSFGGEGPDRLPDVDDSATTMNEITYNFSATNSLFTAPGTNAVPIYGAYTAYGVGTVSSNSILQLSTNDNRYIQTSARKADGVTGLNSAHLLLFWDSADFLTDSYTTFGATFESQITIEADMANAKGVNAIIRDGDTYYLSEALITGSGTLFLTGLDARWAAFDPDDFALYDPSSAPTFGLTDGVFESYVFTDVTGAGLIGKADRGSGNPTKLEVDDFIMSLQRNGDVSDYDVWATQWLPADVSDPTADFDGDLLDNLGEYGLNGNPTNAADTGQTAMSNDGSVFSYVHAKHATDDTLIYRLLDTTDLVNGTVNINGYDSQIEGPVDGAYLTVTNNYDMSGKTEQFIGVEVE